MDVDSHLFVSDFVFSFSHKIFDKILNALLFMPTENGSYISYKKVIANLRHIYCGMYKRSISDNMPRPRESNS